MPDAVEEAELPFVARDGLPLVGTLFSPEGDDRAPLPSVVIVHGRGGSRTSNIRYRGRWTGCRLR